MEDRRRRRLVAGSVLILLGLTLFAVQYVEGIGQSAVFFIIGGVFLGAYLYQREYGLLIPACILMGLGVGSIAQPARFPFGSGAQLGLGIGFVAIFVIALIYERRSHWWPLIPGGILIVTSIPDADRVFDFLLDRGWPLILVIIGLMILLGAFGRSGRRRSGGGEP